MARKPPLSWYADLKMESDLRRWEIPFDVISVPFTSIDLKNSQQNKARMGKAILEHKVADYMQAIRNGDTFPRCVVPTTATGYVLLGGNQRCEAIRRLIDDGFLPADIEIELVLVDTQDQLLLELAASTANNAHGEGPTKEERIQKAVYFVEQKGLAVSDAAKAFIVSATTIRKHMSGEQVRRELLQQGVEAHAIPVETLSSMAALEFDAPAQVKLGTLVAQHLPSADRVKQVVGVLKRKSTPTARAHSIKEFEAELLANRRNGNGKPAHLRPPQHPRRDRFLGMLERLSNFLDSDNSGKPFKNLEQLQITTPHDRERTQELIKRLRYRLGAIAK